MSSRVKQTVPKRSKLFTAFINSIECVVKSLAADYSSAYSSSFFTNRSKNRCEFSSNKRKATEVVALILICAWSFPIFPVFFNSVGHLAKISKLIILWKWEILYLFLGATHSSSVHFRFKASSEEEKLKNFRIFCVILWSKECHTEQNCLETYFIVNFNQIRSSQ